MGIRSYLVQFYLVAKKLRLRYVNQFSQDAGHVVSQGEFALCPLRAPIQVEAFFAMSGNPRLTAWHQDSILMHPGIYSMGLHGLFLLLKKLELLKSVPFIKLLS